MGADLLTAMLIKPAGKKLDYEKALEVAENLTEDDIPWEVWDNLFQGDPPAFGVSEQELLDAKEMVIDAIKYVKEAVEEGKRTVNVWAGVLGYDIIITGETSWGDTPEGVDEFNYVYGCKKVREALGLVDYFEQGG